MMAKRLMRKILQHMPIYTILTQDCNEHIRLALQIQEILNQQMSDHPNEKDQLWDIS